MSKKKLKIVIAGTGKAAHALIPLLQQKHEVLQVVGRNPKKVKAIARKFKIKKTGTVSKHIRNADVYILCVSDKAIPSVSRKLKTSGTVIHLSGASSIDLLRQHENVAVAWPVRSLTGLEPADWKKINILYEAYTEQATTHIKNLFGKSAGRLFFADEEYRSKAHVSIVILNNFIHHLAFKAHTILRANRLDKLLYQSVLQDTFKSLNESDLYPGQTGPARRKETDVIKKQLALLADDPELRDIYKTITKSIIKSYPHG